MALLHGIRRGDFSAGWLLVCLFGWVLAQTPAAEACAPGQYQAVFRGVLWGIKVMPKDELRGYIVPETAASEGTTSVPGGGTVLSTTAELGSDIFLGSTADNPGLLKSIYGRIEFALYACGESFDVGKVVEFRYARGKTEYLAEIQEGSPVFEGREIQIGNPGEVNETQMLLRIIPPPPPPPPIPPPPSPPLFGDFNGDGEVNSADAALVLHQVMMGSGDKKFDVNGDGFVDNQDVREVYLISRGKAPSSADGLKVTADSLLNYVLFVGGNDLRYDITGDGKVNSDDVRALYQKGSGFDVGVTPGAALHNAFFEGGNDPRFDVNKDGAVNLLDIKARTEVQPVNKAAEPSPVVVSPGSSSAVVANNDNEPLTAATVLRYLLFTGGYDKRYDVNGDGKVSADDVQSLLRGKGVGVSSGVAGMSAALVADPNDAAGILRYVLFIGGNDLKYDKNGDGKVDLADVKAAYAP